MHIEIQVALNFVISYLYNKLPRRRVNLFGEELEKALKTRFQGHWYPEKPFKGSAFRCLKTGDPIDAVLDRAARESGVPITDILENLPAELSVWVDPGEVSYRIGEKGAVKILYSESNDMHDDSCADREVTKTFNPEAQCFRPIDAVSNNLSQLSLSPKASPQGSPPNASTTSPPNGMTAPIGNNVSACNGNNGGIVNVVPNASNGKQMATSPAPAGGPFLPRSQAPLTFTTATFAQTKFGSTKLKTSSKRANSRMSPTEFSNYIKQRAMQQQLHHSHGHSTNVPTNLLGPIGSASPSRSISPNPLSSMNQPLDPYFYANHGGPSASAMNGSTTNNAMPLYPPYNNASATSRNSAMFDISNFVPPSSTADSMYSNGGGNNVGSAGMNGIGSKFSSGSSASDFMEPHNFYGMSGLAAIGGGIGNDGASGGIGLNAMQGPTSMGGGGGGNGGSAGPIGGNNSSLLQQQQQQQTSVGSSPGVGGGANDNANLLEGLSSFYSNSGPYQHLLVAN